KVGQYRSSRPLCPGTSGLTPSANRLPFIRNVAYTDTSLLEDLIHVLRFHEFLEEADVDAFRKARDFLALHVIATLHGTPLVMDKKEIVHLRATFSRESRQLGLKAELPNCQPGKADYEQRISRTHRAGGRPVLRSRSSRHGYLGWNATRGRFWRQVSCYAMMVALLSFHKYAQPQS
ncbi:hypothetical protein, partial [Rhizobium leguminosarum]|uniref:hypothetical protein n=1 Tax=Rhizobium leguminosarum TaxID=384 RepID=UPI003F9A3A59